MPFGANVTGENGGRSRGWVEGLEPPSLTLLPPIGAGREFPLDPPLENSTETAPENATEKPGL